MDCINVCIKLFKYKETPLQSAPFPLECPYIIHCLNDLTNKWQHSFYYLPLFTFWSLFNSIIRIFRSTCNSSQAHGAKLANLPKFKSISASEPDHQTKHVIYQKKPQITKFMYIPVVVDILYQKESYLSF